MKSLRIFFILVFTLGIITAGCDDENFDAPPHGEPEYSGEANISIKDFKAKHNELLKEITDNDIITGVITANDVSGNLYKQIFIEDETGGLMIAIDRNNIYNDFRVGQKIFIETKGLYMGKYGGMAQLGYRYSRDNDDNFSIGQITWESVKTHVFKDGYPKPEEVVPIAIDENKLTEDNYGRLVKLEGVYFDDAGEIFSYPTQEGAVQTLNRIVRFASNETQSVTGRMSSAANFASDTIPEGVGSVTGILSVFNNTNQILIREIEDLNFEENPDGWGLENSPWTVDYALSIMDDERDGWVKGYIVGAVAPEINEDTPIEDNSGITFEGDFLPNTIVIASSPDETNWENCLVVNLPVGSQMRDVLNLADNPDALGEEVSVTGILESILGAGGVRIANGTSDEFRFGGVGEEILSASFQSELDPFTEYSVSGAQNWEFDSYGYAKMTGYDGGSDNANEDWLISPAIDLTDYDAAHVTFEHISRYGTNASDFTLWVSSDYTDGDPKAATWTQITIFDYSSGDSWVDWTNSGNLNIPEEFTGQDNVHVALKYLATDSRAGTWEVRNFFVRSGAGESGDEPGGDDPVEGGDGSRDNPYSIASVEANQGATTDKVWSVGYIVGSVNGMSLDDAEFTEPFSSNSNILIAASAGETNIDNCIPVQLPNNDVRPVLNLADNPDNKGKEVLVYGTLETYFNAAGIKNVSNYELDGQTGDIEPPAGTLILEALFAETLDPFTGYSVSGDQEWEADVDYEHAVMSGYFDDTQNANEDWLISSELNLSSYSAPFISFEHAINYATDLGLYTLWVSDDYTGGDPTAATWTELTIPNMPAGDSWEFLESGNVDIPSAFIKDGVTIAFKYESTTSDAGTWEIKNLFVVD